MQRIDTFLVAHQFVESREQAKRLILAGAVTVNGDASIKPGQRVPADAKVVVQAQQKYVSRGGFKLEKALSTFGVDVRDRVALDVGASTGGFTDCLLQHGARFVYAVDVGYGQLAWKLRTHPQVLPIEKTNIRHLTLAHLKNLKPPKVTSEINQKPPRNVMEPCPDLATMVNLKNKQTPYPNLVGAVSNRTDVECPINSKVYHKRISIAVIDVSFISLRTVLPKVIALLRQQDSGQPTTNNHFDIIALLKPQFEAGKRHVKKGGIVSAKRVHVETIDNLSTFVSQKLDVTVRGLTYSPIHKDIANIEYLLWLTVNPNAQADMLEEQSSPHQTTAEIVEAAYEQKRGYYSKV